MNQNPGSPIIDTNVYSEPFYDVDEVEAKEIDSCLNFLSILDEETSNDSCNFTLFRKKEDKQNDISSNKISDDSEIEKINTENIIQDNAIRKTVSSSFNKYLDEDKPIDEKENVNGPNDPKDNVDSPNNQKGNTDKQNDLKDIDKPANIKLLNTNTSPEVKIVSPNMFKINSSSNTPMLIPILKGEASSAIRMKDNIILKVSRSPLKKNSLSGVIKNKIMCSLALDTSKEMIASTRLNHVNNMTSVTCTDRSQPEDIEVLDQNKLDISVQDNTSRECVNESSLDSSDSFGMQDLSDENAKRMASIPADRNRSTVGNKIMKTSIINKNSENDIEAIKILSVKQISKELKGREVDSTAVTSTIKNAVTDNNNSEINCLENDTENRCDDATENLIESLQNKNTLDFVPANPFSAVEIIKKPLETISKAKLEVDRKVKCRILPANKKNKCKRPKALSASMSINQKGKNNAKPINKLKKIYTPLSRTELPTFLKQSDLQENSKNSLMNHEGPTHAGANTGKLEKEKDSTTNTVFDNIILDDESQSSVKSLHKETKTTATNSSNVTFVKISETLVTEGIVLQKDANSDMVSKFDNFVDRLVDHTSYCQNNNLNSNENTSGNNNTDDDVDSSGKKKQEMFNALDWLSKRDDETSLSLDDPLALSEETLSCDSIEMVGAENNPSESTQIPQANAYIQERVEDTSAAVKNISANETGDSTGNSLCKDQLAPFIYSYNSSSPLSFTVQNILENMFKYESFPSSTNMARLAKCVGSHWKDIRDWFVGRRNLSKKNGVYLRNQSLASCLFCPDYTASENHRAIVHLLSKEHIQNMMNSIEKHNVIFTQKIHTEIASKENDMHVKEIPSSETRLDTQDKELEEIEVIKEIIAGQDHKRSETSENDGCQTVTASSKIRAYIENYSVASRSPTDENVKKLNNVFKTPMIPSSEKLKDSVRKNRNIDSTLFIGYRCPVCFKIFNKEWMLIRHSISHRKLICSECDEVFVREDLLKRHFKQHMIESMDDDLYSMYICFKCCNLSCVCVEEAHCAPSLNFKHYIRPQTARRSKPFRSLPYSGVNDHFKVTMDEFWEKYKTRKQKPRTKIKLSAQLTPIKNKFDSKVSPVKKTNVKLNSTPTYTNITTFNCSMCESFFFTPDELEEHVTVHRIRERNRSRKRGYQDDDIEVDKKAKYTKSAPPRMEIILCCYCDKKFKTKNILFKHMKVSCKLIPATLRRAIKNKTALLEKVNSSDRYKIRVETKASTGNKNFLKPHKIKCDLCSLELLADQVECHKRVCYRTHTDNSGKHCLDKIMKEDESVINDNSLSESKDSNELYYFQCKYCDVPLTSPKMLKLHLKDSCNKAPNEVLSELEAQRLSACEITVDKHYTKIDRKKLLDVLSLTKIQQLLDETSFLNVQKNYKRVKCKFCDKNPLKSCLKLHLTKQCKYVPKELQNLMEVYGNSLFNTLKKINNTSILKHKDCKETVTDETLSVDDSKIEHNMLYDCHLCEEKFKISKDFITHMQDFHCMTISEESACKWLSSLDSDSVDTEECLIKNDDVDNDESPTKSDCIYNEESPTKSDSIYGEKSPTKSDGIYSEDYTTKDDDIYIEENPTKDTVSEPSPEKKNELQEERLSTNDTISSEIIDESSLLADYSDPLEEEPSDTSSDKSDFKILLTNTPSKSQKLDDELLNDLTNLDNFIETVQLEDVNFASS